MPYRREDSASDDRNEAVPLGEGDDLFRSPFVCLFGVMLGSPVFFFFFFLLHTCALEIEGIIGVPYRREDNASDDRNEAQPFREGDLLAFVVFVVFFADHSRALEIQGIRNER